MTDETQGTDLATREAVSELANVDPMLVEVMQSLQTGKASVIDTEELTPEQQQLAIVARILRAQTLDEILGSFEATPIDQVLDQPMEIHAVRWERSEYEEGNPYYALIDAVLIDDGNRVTLTTGSTNILTQLVAMAARGYLPAKVIARQSAKPTKRGYYPKHLERAE